MSHDAVVHRGLCIAKATTDHGSFRLVFNLPSAGEIAHLPIKPALVIIGRISGAITSDRLCAKRKR
jgi:hypothetical protein